MASEFRQRVRRLFIELADLSGPERAAALARACGDDAALKAEVQALFRAEEEAEFMASPTADLRAVTRATVPIPNPDIPEFALAASRELEGQMIGRYRLQQLIGEGGFGSVWMAEQREPVKRRVALKIIKLGMDTRQVIARFEAERQALAMMDHPNIAKVLDAGSTEQGRPYFVMEYIKGVPILDYCDTAGLDTRARLELFTHVCHAIQHAHQKGIIHRDIKPSNVMVTMHDGVPVPKVIDFGIAKATNSDLTSRTLFTQHRQMIGTPAYMSPEQAEMSGLDIDTRSDIYSLGVLLYELLTGTTPFANDDLLSKGFAEMMRIIREVEPHKPSTRLSTLGQTGTRTAQQRHAGDARKLGLLLRGDLDWIVMKCLEKNRARRYETANALAADVKRHLAGDAVIAAPPDPWYMLTRILRRHRLALGVAGVVAAALLAGLGLMSYGFVQASKDRDQAEIQREAAERAGKKIQEQSDQAGRVSDLLKSRFLSPAPLGASAKAVAQSVRAEAEEIFGVDHPEVSAMLSAVGTMLSADLTRQQDAIVLLNEAIEYQKRAVGSGDKSLVMPYVVTAAINRYSNKPAAVKACRDVLRLNIESHGEDSLAAANAREALALSLIFSPTREEWSEVLALYQRAIPVYERELGAVHPRTLDSKMAYGQALTQMNKFDEGGAMMEDAYAKSRGMPDVNPQIRFTTALQLLSLYTMRKDKPRQVETLQELASLTKEVLGEGSTSQKTVLGRFTAELRELGESELAERIEKSASRAGDAAGSPAEMLSKAWAAFDAASFGEALEKAVALLRAMPPAAAGATPWDRYARFGVRRLAIQAKARAGHAEEAEREARELLAETESALGPAHGCVVLARRTLAEVLLVGSQPKTGVEAMRSAIQAALDRRPKDFPSAVSMLDRLEQALKDQGEAAQAAATAARAQLLRAQWETAPSLGGFEGEDVGAPPAGWSAPPAVAKGGMLAVVCQKGPGAEPAEGERCLRIGGFTGVDKCLEESHGFRNLMQSFDARPYRGKKVRFSAMIRLQAAPSGGATPSQVSSPDARMWIRADRPNSAKPYLFDNMRDKPIEPGDGSWQERHLTGVVDADAEWLNIGFMVFGEATAWIDDVKLEVIND